MTDSPLAQLDDRLRARRESFDRIPVVDISGLIDGTDKERVAREINAEGHEPGSALALTDKERTSPEIHVRQPQSYRFAKA